MDEVRPHRIEEPLEAAAMLAEVALRLAAILGPHPVDGEVLSALNLQGVRVGTEVDRIPSSARRLAADGAVAGLIRVRRLRLDPEAHSPAVARTFEQHTRLPPAASGPGNLCFRQCHVDVIALDLDLVFGDGPYGREGECFPGGHVELCAVARTLYLVADQLSLVQGTGVVGAYVLDGVELAVHVAERHPVALQLVDANFAGGHVAGPGYLVELGHPVTPHAPRSRARSCPLWRGRACLSGP